MLQIKLCNDEVEWNEFVRSSNTNNIFSETVFLDSINVKYAKYLILKNKKPILGSIIFEDNIIDKPHHYTRQMHQSLVIPNRGLKSFHSSTSDYILGCNYLIKELMNKYKKIVFCLHPYIKDIRPFNWFIYENQDEYEIKIEVLHTGIIKLKDFNNFEDYFKLLPETRKQEFKRYSSLNFQMTRNQNIDDFLELFKLTFKFQNIDITHEYLKIITNTLNNTINNNLGKLDIIYNENNMPIAATMFVNDGKTSNYLHSANNPQFRNYTAGTYLMLNHIKECFDLNIETINMLGVNSPARGYFKTSFNAEVTPFFDVIIELKESRY